MERKKVRDIELRRKLASLTHSLRKSSIPDNVNLNDPQSIKHDTILFGNQIKKRKRIVLLSPGCSVATCTMCPLPNEALDHKSSKIIPENLIEQVAKSFSSDKDANYEIVTIYTNSNFFFDQDVFPAVRKYIYEKVRQSPASILVVESLPQFITEEKILEAKNYLGDKKLTVAIGLQSADDLVRELAVNSTCTKPSFEKAVSLLKKNNYIAQTFLIIRPPFLLEREAIEDVVDSIKYLASLGIADPILCATRVAPNTIVELLYKAKKFRPPWLWTIVEILKRCKQEVPNSNPRVAVSELYPERKNDFTYTNNCSKCSNKIAGLLETFNIQRNIEVFNSLTCACFKDYQNFLKNELPKWKSLTIKERIADFLQESNK
jgi:hypothetical protein